MKNTISAKIATLPLLFLTILFLMPIISKAQDKLTPTKEFLKVFHAIAGENGNSFTKTRLKQFLRDNSFRDSAHNKDSFLYASDFSSMKASFQSGIFGDLVVKVPICDSDRRGTVCWDVTVWGFKFENSNVPILIPDNVSDSELIEINTMIYLGGGKARLDRKISVDAFADLVFDIMVENSASKTEVTGLGFLVFCRRVTGQSVNVSNVPSPNQTTNNVAVDKFTAPADSPIIGTWKYVEYGTTESLYDGSKSSYVKRTSTFIYSQNGVVESIHQDSIRTDRIKGNWKYIPKTANSGILEEYLGNDLVEKATVKYSSRNQLEYTITFSQNSDLIGKQSVWTRQ